MKTALSSVQPTANLLGAGRTPLHYAAMHGRVAAVEELVRQGASVREKDIRGGYTPLHLAADAGQCEAICKLAALGAPLEALSNKGWTPLALATFKVASRQPCRRHIKHCSLNLHPMSKDAATFNASMAEAQRMSGLKDVQR